MMNILTVLLSRYSSGGEAFFVGAVTALAFMLIAAIWHALKPVARKTATNIAVTVNPNNVNSLIKKGYFEMEKQHYRSAIDCFQKAINLAPDNNDVLAGITFAFHLQKDYVNSKIYIKKYRNNLHANTADNTTITIMTYLYGHHCFMEGNLEQAQRCKENAKTFAMVSDDAAEIINNLNLY
jgi:cytochrome c-type biogenesis protein CcmH/NrfG